jgi:hypothetical protein
LHNILTDNVAGSQALREKVGIACAIAAETIISGGDDTDPPWDQAAGKRDQRLKWADRFLRSPVAVTREVFWVVVAANESATQSNILSASDSTIQTNVNGSVDSLAAGLPDLV